MLTFTWTTEPCRWGPQGVRYVLRCPAFPKHHFSPLCADDRLATVAYYGGRVWIAKFYEEYDSVSARGGTWRSAMARLEKILDKRSIGLFDADDIRFEVKWCPHSPFTRM